jgi:hypothetical protein
MKTALSVAVAILSLSVAVQGTDVDVGSIDQKAPAKKDLVAPKSDEGIATVGLQQKVKGKAPKGDRQLYIVVSPIGNPDLANTWWVQEPVARDGESFSASAQFGEEEKGQGEYFAILGVATSKKWEVGDMLKGLPDDAAYTKIKIVKRK